VTIGPEGITSQQTFDGYITSFAELTLRLVNELATTHLGGRTVVLPAPAEVDPATVNATFTDDDTKARHPSWSTLSAADAIVLVTAIRKLREAVDACIDGAVSHAAQLLNAVLTAHHAVPNLHGEPGGRPVLAFHAAGSGRAEARVAEMATSLAMIIGTDRSARLGRCSASRCDRVFYDATRNGSRRYCDLACQNRAKASAYRARRAG